MDGFTQIRSARYPCSAVHRRFATLYGKKTSTRKIGGNRNCLRDSHQGPVKPQPSFLIHAHLQERLDRLPGIPFQKFVPAPSRTYWHQLKKNYRHRIETQNFVPKIRALGILEPHSPKYCTDHKNPRAVTAGRMRSLWLDIKGFIYSRR